MYVCLVSVSGRFSPLLYLFLSVSFPLYELSYLLSISSLPSIPALSIKSRFTTSQTYVIPRYI